MRPLWCAIGLLAVGCFGPEAPIGLGCSETGACPPGQFCVDAVCIELACVEVCGDVDQDGDVDFDDSTRLDEITDGAVESDPCARVFGDLDGDGNLDNADEDALDRVLSELATSTCQACSLSCADMDGNGALEDADGDLIQGLATSSELPTLCELASADLDGSSRIDDTDVRLFDALRTGKAALACQPCAQECGDVQPNNTVELIDVTAARDIALGNVVPDLCSFVAADVNGDDAVDQRDVGIIDAIADGVVNRECQRCTGICGDFDQDGDVDNADVGKLRSALNNAGPVTPCEMDAGDIDGNFVLEGDDADAIEAGDPLPCNGPDPAPVDP